MNVLVMCIIINVSQWDQCLFLLQQRSLLFGLSSSHLARAGIDSTPELDCLDNSGIGIPVRAELESEWLSTEFKSDTKSLISLHTVSLQLVGYYLLNNCT